MLLYFHQYLVNTITRLWSASVTAASFLGSNLSGLSWGGWVNCWMNTLWSPWYLCKVSCKDDAQLRLAIRLHFLSQWSREM